VYERLGGFDTSLRIAADYDCMVRFLRSGINVAYIPETLVRMRVGGESNRSLRNIVRKSAEDYRVLQRHGVGGVRALMLKNLRKVPQFFRR
jgi:glycosyltransferase